MLRRKLPDADITNTEILALRVELRGFLSHSVTNWKLQLAFTLFSSCITSLELGEQPFHPWTVWDSVVKWLYILVPRNGFPLTLQNQSWKKILLRITYRCVVKCGHIYPIPLSKSPHFLSNKSISVIIRSHIRCEEGRNSTESLKFLSKPKTILNLMVSTPGFCKFGLKGIKRPFHKYFLELLSSITTYT